MELLEIKISVNSCNILGFGGLIPPRPPPSYSSTCWTVEDLQTLLVLAFQREEKNL